MLVLVLPLTRHQNLFGADLLPAADPARDIINGRGALIDEEALLAAIDAKVVGHATLMCLRPSRFRRTIRSGINPHVTITPSAGRWCRRTSFRILANYAAFASGRPMQNVIDLERQY